MNGLRARHARQFLEFGLSGLPAFILALLLNVLLNEVAQWPKPLAYVLVVGVQLTCGFLMCHFVVFRKEEGRTPFWAAYRRFALSMGLIRAADWACYTVLVEVAETPYVIAQITTTCLFLVIKFASARAIFSSKMT